jgi:hypothetical protein
MAMTKLNSGEKRTETLTQDRSKPMRVFKCLRCGIEVTVSVTPGRPKKFCSEECRVLYRKETSKGPKKVKRICHYCWSPYYTYGKKTKSCSRSCTQKLRGSKIISDSCTGSKACAKCGVIKPVYEYSNNRNASDGFQLRCKLCDSEAHKKRLDTPGKRSAYNKRRRIMRKTDPDKLQKEREYRASWLGRRRKLEAIKRKSDKSYVLKNRMRCLMYSSIRKSKDGRKWQDLVGYSISDLKEHLEKKFTKGMTWEKFIAGAIHIDHKVPISAFNFTRPEEIDFKRCWARRTYNPFGPKRI